MQELSKREAVALDISRKAAHLFLERGVAETSGDDIAAACGLSTRTIWRHFRTKESSVEPLLAATSYRIVTWMTAWPAEMSVEDYLHEAIRPDQQTPQDRA
ncbi:MAG: helix-turn-helix domain-containing protein, partial [Henriciella sp.]